MKLFIAAILVLVQFKCFATVTISIEANKLKTASGQPMPVSGLVILVANTNNTSFSQPTAQAFVSGGNIVVAKWDLSAFQEPGVLSDAAVLTLFPAWTSGNPLELYWFPTLTLASTAPGPGATYGQYRDAVGIDGSAAWVTPSDGATISLAFLTTDANTDYDAPGSNPALAGLASQTAAGGATTNSVFSSVNPAIPGASVTFTSSLSVIPPGAGTPAGTVTFKDGPTTLGTSSLNGSGVATLGTSSLSHGNHVITAEYPGNSSFVGSTNTLSPNQIINTPPVANLTNYNRSPGLTLKIGIADLLAGATTDADGDAWQLTTLGVPAGGGAVSHDTTWIYYTPPVSDANDNFTYTVGDGFGGSATATINVTRTTPSGLAQSISVSGGSVIVNFAGIPGCQYDVERTTNIVNPTWTVILTTNTPASGLFQVVDSNPPQPSAYYRTKQH